MGTRWPPIAGIAGVLVLAVGVVAYVRASDDSDDTGADGDVTVEVEAGPGTELPGGLVVAPGSASIGPPVVMAVDSAGEPTSWFAVLQIDGDPIEVWKDYAGQIAGLFPREGIDPGAAPGCLPPGAEADRRDGTLCSLLADTVDQDVERRASVELVSLPGDVTGHHLLRLELSADRTGSPSDFHEGGGEPWSGDPLPGPEEPRDRPGVGEPLAPSTVAYPDGVGDGGGDNERYVLLEGSELLAQYGRGSITGGFDVVLRVLPDADLDAVAAAYAEQAKQYEGEPAAAPEAVEHGGTTVRIHRPAGGAGGYSGEVIAVDQAGAADDYVFYSLAND